MSDSSFSAAEVQALFNRIAPAYDDLNDRLSFGLHLVWKKMAVAWSRARPGAVCLDLCCGSGDLAQLLSKRVGPTGQVYGVDFASAQLTIAQQRAEQRFPPLSIDWTEADALDLPFADNFFDAATMGYGLRNVGDPLASLQEIRRVLKPQAAVAVLDFHRPDSAIARSFQQWYLDYWVVPTAADLGLKADYAYIGPSLDRFPVGRVQVQLAHQAGFTQAVHYPIVGGMMGVLVATK